MEITKKTIVLNILGIIGLFGGTLALVLCRIFNPFVLILAAVACYPMAKFLYKLIMGRPHDTRKILLKTLPKIGFNIEHTEMNESRTESGIYGSYKGEYFTISTKRSSWYISIIELPWDDIKSTSAEIPAYLEAINEINSKVPNMSVVLSEPDEEGMRNFYTVCSTTILTNCTEIFLENIFNEMLFRKKVLFQAMLRDRPYMPQRRETVGFNIQKDPETQEDPLESAAKTDSQVTD